MGKYANKLNVAEKKLEDLQGSYFGEKGRLKAITKRIVALKKQILLEKQEVRKYKKLSKISLA